MATARPDRKVTPPTAQKESGGSDRSETEVWEELARSAFSESTTYLDSNLRKGWEDSIRAFNSQHASSSKYASASYDKRSKIFRPRIRAVIRKNEAAAAAAFFSNTEVVSVTATDATSKAAVASAGVMKELLQYRLTKSIPWFLTVLGGLQDAQSVGAVCAHVYWDYVTDGPEQEDKEPVTPVAAPGSEEYPNQSGAPQGALVASDAGGLASPPAAVPAAAPRAEPRPVNVRVDAPCVELIPLENLRISPAASWVDPIGTSPYLIHLIPMYTGEVKERMARGEWFELPDSVIAASTELKVDSTRAARNKDRNDQYSEDSAIDAYTIVWVQRHIHRREGHDWEFYMMGDAELLTEPKPLDEVVLHGIRPYVFGCCVIETHKVYSSSLPQLARGLIDEGNEIANQRIDNIKFVLNKKWFVKRGKEADIAGLIRNVPGGVVMLDDPANDVREINWADVTTSSFQEQAGINQEMDDLVGNFNPASIMAAGNMNAPARNMAMLANSQGTLVEYLLRTYVETFVQPVLRQLVLLEQNYETDEVVLALAAKNAKLYQRFGTDDVTDSLLRQELTLTVNVGMGSTDPIQKLNKFVLGMRHYVAMLEKPHPGLDLMEIGKEIFGLLGYRDGSRFFSAENPQLAGMSAQLNQAMQIINAMKQKLGEKQTGHVVKLETSKAKNQTDLQRTLIHEHEENKRALATHFRALHEKSLDHNRKDIRGG